MNARHFFAVSAAVMLGGCQICTDCEPVDYVFDEPDIVYGDTFYLDEGSDVFTEDIIVGDEVWTEGETWTADVIPDYLPDYTFRPAPSYYYPAAPRSYWPQRQFSRQLPYSGPPFTTPPMQPVPYPTETYYPFKRPSPGVYSPWRSTYYNYSAPTYRPMPYYY